MLNLLFLLLVSVGRGATQWFDNTTCGMSKYPDAGEVPCSNRIVGGCESRPNEFPWQVSLQGSEFGMHVCGGSLINTEWVVTAARCVEGVAPIGVWVKMGSHNRTSNDGGEVVTRSIDIILHPEWTSNYDYDVAVIKLTTPVTLNENIWPVCAPSTTDHTAFFGLPGQISGWGTLSSADDCCPQTLQWVDITILPDLNCRSVYLGSYSDRMLCGGEEDFTVKDSCEGDTGGPFTYKRENGQFELVGDTSWGLGCASGYPSIYGNIPVMRDWITDTINNN